MRKCTGRSPITQKHRGPREQALRIPELPTSHFREAQTLRVSLSTGSPAAESSHRSSSLGTPSPSLPMCCLGLPQGFFFPAAPQSPSNDSRDGFLSHWFQLNPPGLSPPVAISPALGFRAKCVGIPRGPAEERDSRGPPACSTRRCTAPSPLLVRLFYKPLL